VAPSARFDGPFRVIRGERSSRVDAEALQLIHHHFPAASLHTVANAGHWPHAEAPADFMRILDDCLLL
jgi:pimeloyl-ACP methyl ester carboxylesterase